MPSSFSRTLRSLKHEKSTRYIAQIGLSITLVLALLWGNWFLTEPLLIYETSHEISVTSEEATVIQTPQNEAGAVRPRSLQKRVILAKFPSAAMERIQPGQSAFLRLKGQEQRAIPAVVVEIMDAPTSKQGLVKLHTLLESAHYYPFTSEEQGEITIERIRGVPAHWILRASGLTIETPSVSVSPQPRYHP